MLQALKFIIHLSSVMCIHMFTMQLPSKALKTHTQNGLNFKHFSFWALIFYTAFFLQSFALDVVVCLC